MLFCRDDQLGSGKTQSLTVGDAVRSGVINNETLAYFMARTQLFLEKVSSKYMHQYYHYHHYSEYVFIYAVYNAESCDLKLALLFKAVHMSVSVYKTHRVSLVLSSLQCFLYMLLLLRQPCQ